jgi:hypothetical protein
MSHQIYQIKNFRIVKPYTIDVIFNDGVQKQINFLPILKGEMYGPLKDLAYFEKVCLDHEAHTISWPNGADFDPEMLYNWDAYIDELIHRAKSWSV